MPDNYAFRLDVGLMFNALMAFNVKLCAVIVILPFFFQSMYDFSPAFISLVFVSAVIFCAMWTFVCLKILAFFTRIRVAPEGIRCQSGKNAFQYQSLEWDSIGTVKLFKVFKLQFLKLISEDQAIILHLPLHLLKFNEFKDKIYEYTDANHPLRAYF